MRWFLRNSAFTNVLISYIPWLGSLLLFWSVESMVTHFLLPSSLSPSGSAAVLIIGLPLIVSSYLALSQPQSHRSWELYPVQMMTKLCVALLLSVAGLFLWLAQRYQYISIDVFLLAYYLLALSMCLYEVIRARILWFQAKPS